MSIEPYENERQRMNEALQKAYDIIEISNIVVFEWTLSLDTPIKFVTQNISQFGYKPEDFYSGHLKDYWEFVYHKDRKKAIEIVYNSRRSGRDSVKHSYRVVCKDGNLRWVEEFLTIERNEIGEPVGEKGILRDITNEKRYEDRLKYLSYHDALTGLYNRHYFLEKLDSLHSGLAFPYSVIIGDLNGLKAVNDSFGHEMGDRLLKDTSKLLKENCRKTDTIARLGGDEFGIILEKTDEDEAFELWKNLKNACETHPGKFYKISIALGYATSTDYTLSNEELCKRADDMMYDFKQSHRKSHKKSSVQHLQQNLKEKTLETREHSERLKRLSVKIGLKYKLEKDALEDLKLVATMHDIGKIAIPNELLSKKAKLTSEEWGIIKTHSEIGYHIILACTNIDVIAQAIRHHHERWDGTGYPLGLKAEEIPLFSRIISVVDAYDAMVHHRPYSKRKSKEQALEELNRCKGTQFDPEVVQHFIDLMTRT